MRLINPAKQHLGKASKIILARIVEEIKVKTNLNLSRSTDETLKWFKKLQHGKNRYFLQLDIVNMYPSIKHKLVKDAIEWAKTLGVKISDTKYEVINHCRQSLLIHNGESWEKKPELELSLQR